jgi:hypothetical protein
VGDGVLELKSVDGTVLIGTNAQPARGALWGQMDRGTLRVLDPIAGDGQVYVSGFDKKPVISFNADGLKVMTYTGRDLHFRVTGGKYKLFFNASGIDLTAVGAGVAYLNGDENAADPGFYAVDSGKWTPVPLFTLKAVAVPFGDQPAQTP